MQEKLNTLKHQQGKDYTMCSHFLCLPKQEKVSSIVESVQETKKTVYNHKLPSSKLDFHNMKPSKILEVDSISKEKDLTPYWNKSCEEMSKKLLLLTKTDYVDSDSILSNPLQTRTLAGSWFSNNLTSHLKPSLFKTYFSSSMFSHVDFTALGDTVIRSKKIRIYPKNKQLFNQYLGLTRYWYNQAIEYLKKPETKSYLPEVRKICKEVHPDWAMDCPQRIREHAIADAVAAVKSAKKKFKKEGFQEVSFRSKKDVGQRFGFDKKSLHGSYVFSMKKYKARFYSTEDFNTEMEGCEITKENGKFYLIIPVKTTIKVPENQRFNCVALDPGVRTFQTIFSPEVQGKIGEGDFKKIYRLCLNMDKLISKKSKAKCKAKRNINKALERLRWKIKDLIDDMHKKTAYFLVTNFDVVLIPTFETSQMVTKLRSKTSRSMLTFAHYRFKEFLKNKAQEYSCKVIEVSEAYTSKTCSYCGKIQNIGSKKTMKCSCGVCVDRDINGARGIYLRALAVTPV